MATFVVRVWLPDRPGALGAVASRIGAVRGDVVGIDILERGGGRVIDELAVELPDESLVPLLVSEVGEVDGVDVEDVRPVAAPLRDARLDALETAALLVEEDDPDGVLAALVHHARHDFDAEWAAVVDDDGESLAAGAGRVPPTAWLAAFAAGSRWSGPVAAGESGPDDVACAQLRRAGMVLVLGRHGRPFRARERRQAAALARIADARLVEVAARTARIAHPSAR